MLEQQGWQALPSLSYNPPVWKYQKYHTESISEGQLGCEEKHQIGLGRYIGKVSQLQKKRKLMNTFDDNRDITQEKTEKGFQRWLAQPLTDEDKWGERIAWLPHSSFKKISVIKYFFSKQLNELEPQHKWKPGMLFLSSSLSELHFCLIK